MHDSEKSLETRYVVYGVLCGLVAAIVGGVVWGYIAKITDYEVGYVAWGIGFLVGFSVYLGSGKRRGRLLGVFAAALSLLGIIIGKYLVMFFALKKYIADEAGAELANQVTLLGADMRAFFTEEFFNILSPYDALWVILAVATGWVTLTAKEKKPPEAKAEVK